MGRVPQELGSRLTSAARDLRSFFSAAACSIALTSPDGAQLRFAAADGVGAEAIIGVELPITRGVAGWVAMAGQSIAVSDVRSDPRFARDVAESTDYVPRALMAAPLLGKDDDVLGVVEVLDPALGVDPTTALGLLGVVSRQLAAIVEVCDADAAGRDGMPSGPGGVVADFVAMDAASQLLVEEILAAVRNYTTARR